MRISKIFVCLVVIASSTTIVKEEAVPATPKLHHDRIDPEHLSHVLGLKRLSDVPPIVHIVTMVEEEYAQLEEGRVEEEIRSGSDDFLSEALDRLPTRLVVYFDTLATVIDDYADRIFEQFPNVEYDEQVDGVALRNISATVSILAKNRSHTTLISQIVRRMGWMRKWTRTIVSMMEYIVKRPFLSMSQTEIVLISLAPTMHAFMHALFHLEIDFPNLFNGFQSLVSNVSKHHPMYVEDPVWFLRIGREFGIGQYPVFRSIPTFVSDAEFFENAWGDEFGTFRSNPRLLVAKTHAFINDPIFLQRLLPWISAIPQVVDSLASVLFTIQYFREHEPEVFDRLLALGLVDLKIQSVDKILRRIITMASLVKHFSTVRGVVEIFGHLILDDDARLEQITAVGHLANRLVPMSQSDNSFHMQSKETVALMLEELGGITKFNLAGYIFLDAISIESLFDEMLMDVFDPDNGVFEVTPSGLYAPRTSSSTALVGVGRLLGLVFKSGNHDNILQTYVFVIRGSPPAGIFQTLFFGSQDIRTGFYDVILENTVESVYPDSLSFVHVLELLSINTRIVA